MVHVVFIPTSRQPNMLGPVSLVVQLGISFSWKKSGCSPATAFVAVWLLSNIAEMLVCWKKASNQQRHQGAFPPADFASESPREHLSSKFAPQFSCLNVSPFKLDKKDPTDNPSHYLADTCCIILLPPPELGTSSLWCRNLDDVISIRWSWDLKLISNSKEGSKLQHHCLDNFWLRQHLIRQCRTATWGKLRLATIFCMKSNNCTTKNESVHSQQPT